MRIIYLDILIGVNLAIDYLMLFALSRISGIYSTRFKLFLGALLGSLYAVLSCIVEANIITSLPIKIAISTLMVLICFGYKNKSRFLKLLLLFLFISFAVAGGVLALGNISNNSFFAGSGYYINNISFKTIVIAMLISWIITGFIFRNEAKDTIIPRKTVKADVYFLDNHAEYTLLVDTGNTLHDIISGKPVIILDRFSASQILPINISLNRLHTENAADILSNIPENYVKYFRLIPFNAVGKNSGLLLSFKPDKITIDGKIWHGLVSINADRICSGQYQGLIGL